MRSILLVIFPRRRLLGRRRIETFTLLICLLLCSLSISCIIPLPKTARTRTPTGVAFETKVNLDFIQIGSTTRQEVVKKLLEIDTGVRDERLFWGRWARSSTKFLLIGAGGAGSLQEWKSHNAMIEFDEKGFVKAYRAVPDESVVKELTSWVAREASSEFCTPVEITVAHRHAWSTNNSSKLILTEDFFEFQESKNGSHNFRIAREKVKRVSKAGRREDPDPKYFVSSIHFREKTKAGRRIAVEIDIPSLIVLLKYLRAEKFVEQDPRLAASLNERGKYAEAEPLDWWALGPEHPSMAISYNNLAGLYYNQGRHAEAELYLQGALALLEMDLGPEHLDVAKVLENYIALLRKMNRDAEAEELEARVQAIRAKHAEENPSK